MSFFENEYRRYEFLFLTIVFFQLHGTIVMPYFANYGTQDQKDYYMPKLCSGEMVAAIAMTEPGK